jgi:hypothetical protein
MAAARPRCFECSSTSRHLHDHDLRPGQFICMGCVNEMMELEQLMVLRMLVFADGRRSRRLVVRKYIGDEFAKDPELVSVRGLRELFGANASTDSEDEALGYAMEAIHELILREEFCYGPSDIAIVEPQGWRAKEGEPPFYWHAAIPRKLEAMTAGRGAPPP